MPKYFSLSKKEKQADIVIYGDITSWEFLESDVSSYTLSKMLSELDADAINVHINSYGGEVSEGLAIYNALKNHKAKVTTVCDGFACSAASVVFMAGCERVMNPASLLMIHNAWTVAEGNADELRKQADDLEKISDASKPAYLSAVNISEEELTELMDKETWITPDEALDMGFATEIAGKKAKQKASQSARESIYRALTRASVSDAKEEKNESKEPELDELSVWADFFEKLEVTK